MFDIGFLELLIIAVVALLVVGPERLPKLAVTVGQYIGRMQRLWENTRYEIEREVHNAEIKEVTDQIGDDLHEIVNDIDDEVDKVNNDIDSAISSVTDEVKQDVEVKQDKPND